MTHHRIGTRPMRPAAIAALVAVMLVSGGGHVEAKQSGPPAREVVIAIDHRISSFDPITVEYSRFPDIGELLFNTLVWIDMSGNPVPELAESWSFSEDGTECTVVLRRGVMFHDGTTLTAADVVATYRRALAGPLAGRMFVNPQSIVEIVPRSDYELVFVTDGNPKEMLNNLGIEIVAESTGDAPLGPEAPVGTGPFRVESIGEDEICLVSNLACWKGAPGVSEVVVKCFPSHSAGWAAFLRGEVDAVYEITQDEARAIADNPKYRVYDYLDPFYYTLTMNNEDPLLSDLELRRALSIGIDRADLVSVALQGGATVATVPMFPRGRSIEPRVDPLFDPVGAGKGLTELGWVDRDRDGVRELPDGTRLHFSLLFDEGDISKARVASRLKWQFLRLGARLEIEELPVGEFLGARLIPGEYQLALLQYTVGIDPVGTLERFWRSDMVGMSNIARYRSDRFDRAIAEEADTAERQVERAAEIVVGEHASAFLFFPKRYAAVVADIVVGEPISAGLFFRSVGTWRFTDAVADGRNR